MLLQASWLAMPSPLVVALSLLPPVTEAGGASARQIAELWSVHLWFMGAVCALLLVLAWTRLTALMRQG